MGPHLTAAAATACAERAVVRATTRVRSRGELPSMRYRYDHGIVK